MTKEKRFMDEVIYNSSNKLLYHLALLAQWSFYSISISACEVFGGEGGVSEF